jgi:glutaredoxin
VKTLTLYTRVGCHLCDVMKERLDAIGQTHPFALELVDIDKDAALKQLYDHEVPVLLVDGAKVAKYRLDEPMLLRRLEAAS